MTKEQMQEQLLNKHRKKLVEQELLRRKASSNLLDFCMYTKHDYKPQWFHKYICNQLEDFMLSQDEIFVLNLPPQHGKSEISSRRFPAYWLGKNPTLKLGLISYSADVAAGFNNDIQQILACDEYRKLFPATKIAGVGGIGEKELRKNSYIFDTSEQGYLISTGVGGALTSKTLDLLIIDDVYKNPEQGWNSSHRTKVSEWFWSVAYTRLHNSSKIVLVFTRWAEMDLAGELLSFFKGKKIRYINIEAVKETPKTFDPRGEGEALWESQHKLEKLLIIKKKNEIIFESLYQGNPKPQKGLMYPNNFKTYSSDKLQELIELGCPVKSYTDTADTGSDFLTTYIFVEHDKRAYIKDIIFTQDDMKITIPLWAERHACNRVNNAKIEYNNGGHPFKLFAEEKLIKEFLYNNCYIEGFHQTQNKELRILSQAAWVQENILFPEDWHIIWAELYISLTRHNRVGKNAHDDAADALTGVAEMINVDEMRGIIEINCIDEDDED